MLTDMFGRRFYYLRLSITDICNFRCTYCLPEGYQGRPDDAFLSTAEITAVARGFVNMGTQKIRLTGGEPSLRKDLPDIMAGLSQLDGLSTLALTTNGYHLPKHVETWAKAGLNQLNVSIDSLDARRFHSITGHDRLAEVLEGVKMARALGIKTKVNAVLMKGVNDDLTAMLAWLKETPVTVRYIEVMETSDQRVFFREHHIRGEEIKTRLLNEGWQPVLRGLAAGPAQEFWHPEYQGRIGLIMPYSKDFCASCNRLRISSLGKLHLCLFSEQGIDIRPYLQPGVSEEVLMNVIVAHLKDKRATHYLQDHLSGSMANLSQIGG